MRSGTSGRGPIQHVPSRRRSRRAAAVMAAVLVVASGATACTDASNNVAFPTTEAVMAAKPRHVDTAAPELAGRDATASTTATTAAPPLAVQFQPQPGTVDVRPDTAVRVAVSGGQLVGLEVDTPNGKAEGTLNGNTFKPTGGLRFGTEYVLSATVTDSHGNRSVHTSAFATMAPAPTIDTYISPEDGEVVGIGHPIIVAFSDDIPVADRGAVTAKLSVKTVPEVPGAWRWVNDAEVHWRPLQYWPAHTQVWVAADLAGTAAGTRWFSESTLQQFTIGDSHRITIDAATHQMTVFVNGTPVRQMPISTGRDAYPTASGIDLIMEKHDVFEMDSSSVGIYGAEAYNVVVDDAQRLTNSGTFIHAAPWNYSLGEANLSHGCINASNEDAQWMMDFTLLGDPVEISNTSEQVSPTNGWGDWNVSAADWLAPQG